MPAHIWRISAHLRFQFCKQDLVTDHSTERIRMYRYNINWWNYYSNRILNRLSKLFPPTIWLVRTHANRQYQFHWNVNHSTEWNKCRIERAISLLQTHELNFKVRHKCHNRKVVDKVALCNLFTFDVGSHWIRSVAHILPISALNNSILLTFLSMIFRFS